MLYDYGKWLENFQQLERRMWFMDHLVFAVWRRISTADEACRKDFYDPASFTPHYSLHTNGGQYFYVTFCCCFSSFSCLRVILWILLALVFFHCALQLRKFVLLDSRRLCDLWRSAVSGVISTFTLLFLNSCIQRRRMVYCFYCCSFFDGLDARWSNKRQWLVVVVANTWDEMVTPVSGHLSPRSSIGSWYW